MLVTALKQFFEQKTDWCFRCRIFGADVDASGVTDELDNTTSKGLYNSADAVSTISAELDKASADSLTGVIKCPKDLGATEAKLGDAVICLTQL